MNEQSEIIETPSSHEDISLENKDKYAFILITCHGEIPVECFTDSEGNKKLDVIVAKNDKVTLTQFTEASAGCYGLINDTELEIMKYYLADQLHSFYDILETKPLEVTPAKTYKFFVKTAYNFQRIIRGKMFNTPLKEKTYKYLDKLTIDEHNSSLDFTNMQYISKNFIEKLYTAEQKELDLDQGVILFTKEHPSGINIFKNEEILNEIQQFEKELQDMYHISYESLTRRSPEHPRRLYAVSLFYLILYLESIGITQTYLYDTSCSTFNSIKQPGSMSHCDRLTYGEMDNLKIYVRKKIILNKKQRRRTKKHYKKKAREGHMIPWDYEDDQLTLEKKPSVGSLAGPYFSEDRRLENKHRRDFPELTTDVIINGERGTKVNNPLQKYPTDELNRRYEKYSRIKLDSDTEIDEPTKQLSAKQQDKNPSHIKPDSDTEIDTEIDEPTKRYRAKRQYVIVPKYTSNPQPQPQPILDGSVKPDSDTEIDTEIDEPTSKRNRTSYYKYRYGGRKTNRRKSIRKNKYKKNTIKKRKYRKRN